MTLAFECLSALLWGSKYPSTSTSTKNGVAAPCHLTGCPASRWAPIFWWLEFETKGPPPYWGVLREKSKNKKTVFPWATTFTNSIWSEHKNHRPVWPSRVFFSVPDAFLVVRWVWPSRREFPGAPEKMEIPLLHSIGRQGQMME